jgi:tetraacyldisaccharide 4'-kinase
MKPVLYFLSLFHRLGTKTLRFLYDQNIKKRKSVPIPVISVGNITFGGSEKTPLSIKLITILFEKGFNPALISRGYKGKWEKSGGEVSPENIDSIDWKTSGDEPYMTARNVPDAGIFLGKNRVSSCLKAYKKGYDIAVMDDGFQYFSLKKDMEIVLHDMSDKALLRESLSALKKAHIILLKKNPFKNKKDQRESLPLRTPVFEYSVFCKGLVKLGTDQITNPEKFQKKKVLAFSGIARPQRFLNSLEEKGIKPDAFIEFPDHYDYPMTAVDKIIYKYQSINSDIAVTTEKDAVKLEHLEALKDLPVYYSKIDLCIEQGFFDMVFSKLNTQEK